MSISCSQRGKNKTWSYRVFDTKGKLLATASGFSTKKEAELEAMQIELKASNHLTVNSSASLYELWQEWLDVSVRPLDKSEATLSKHQRRGDLLLQMFGDLPATQIKFSQYQRELNKYAERVTKDTVRRLNAEVRKVIQFAQRDHLDITDFTEGAIITGKRASKAAHEKYISNIADYYKLLSELKGRMDYQRSVTPYLLFIEAKTGLRFGEAVGLTWDCIDWEDKTIHTYRRYDSVTYQWKPPKTETSVRHVPIDDETITVLKKLQHEQARTLFHHGIKNEKNFLFYDVVYGVPTNTGVNKYLRLVLKKQQIKPYNLTATGLRHTYASILLAKGVDIWVVATVLGHKDIKQVTETYGHLLKEKKDKEYNLIRSLLQVS